MELLTLVGVAFLFLLLGVPIGISLCSGLLAVCFLHGNISLTFIAQAMYTGQESLPILAVPGFILAGNLMEKGGLSIRLVNIAKKMIGHTNGGLGNVTVLSCMFFGAISGSAPATTAAIGSIMIPYMEESGYDRPYCAGLSAISGSLGIIIPPSIPFVVFASVTGASVGKLFLSGFLPGIIVGLGLMLVHTWRVKKKGLVVKADKENFKAIMLACKEGIWAILMPVIILGGIYAGVFTPTEASVVAIFYGLVVGLFVYKELKLKDIWKIFMHTASFVGGFMLAYAPACALGSTLILLNVTDILSGALLSVSTNYYVIMLLVVIGLMIAGMFLDTTSCLVILGPILFTILTPMGVNVIHLGVLMIVCLAVGFVTPPVCMTVFIASNMTKIPMEPIVKTIIPHIIILFLICVLIAFVPQISTLFA